MLDKLSRRRLLLAAGGAFVLPPAIGLSAQKPITLAVVDDYMPMFGKNSDGSWSGYAIDLAHRLVNSDSTGLELVYSESFGWKRSLKSMEVGYYDMLFQVSFRKDRQKYMEYIGTSDFENCWVITRESLAWDTIEEIDDFTRLGIKISVSKAPKWHPEFDRRLVEDHEFASYFNINDAAQVFDGGFTTHIGKMISLGRIDAYLLGPITAPQTVFYGNKHFEETGLGGPLKAIPVSAFGTTITNVCMSLKTPENHREMIRKNYAEARADGSFNAIWQKWHRDIPPPPDVPPHTT